MGRELVECHAGYSYAQRPTALWWAGERLEVETVEVEQRVPTGRRFVVRTRGGHRFELLYDESEDGWELNPV